MSEFNTAQFNQMLFGGAASPPGAVLQVGQGLLYPALRKAAITIGPQRVPSPAQFQDAIEELTRLIGSLNIDRYFIYTRSVVTAPLTDNEITIGLSLDPSRPADIVMARPDGIEAANILSGSPPVASPITMFTDLDWSQTGARNVPATVPGEMYYDRAYPVATISLRGQPLPESQIELFCWSPVPTFTSLADVVVLPNGYVDALVLNLAVRLAPHFQREVHPDVRQQARESLMRVLSLNAPQPMAATGDIGCGCGGYDIYTDR